MLKGYLEYNRDIEEEKNTIETLSKVYDRAKFVGVFDKRSVIVFKNSRIVVIINKLFNSSDSNCFTINTDPRIYQNYEDKNTTITMDRVLFYLNCICKMSSI